MQWIAAISILTEQKLCPQYMLLNFRASMIWNGLSEDLSKIKFSSILGKALTKLDLQPNIILQWSLLFVTSNLQSCTFALLCVIHVILFLFMKLLWVASFNKQVAPWWPMTYVPAKNILFYWSLEICSYVNKICIMYLFGMSVNFVLYVASSFIHHITSYV